MFKLTFQSTKPKEPDVVTYDCSLENTIKGLRDEREKVCFSVINRGRLWYNRLTTEQYAELEIWYQAWLDVTDTLVRPLQPTWLNDKLEMEEIL